ncbi:glycosyltransferase, partial [Microbacterium sp. 18062]|uniref:glycosyltransferase n=1 Tax=Microbacterium sp. 18062 TaxID=2681410 RepID=UPI00135B4395
MIGYYIHHHGRGHLGRARAVADALGEPVTGLSSLARPDAWPGEWIALALDVPDGGPDAATETTAQGRLHWAPVGVDGLRDRMAAVSAWIAAARPSVVVVDVSVEVALLARLHGVRVVTVALPGVRDDDAHALGFEVSTAIIAAWPPDATGMLSGLSAHAAARLHPVGAVSRFPPAGETPSDAAASARPRRALVLAGGGGDDFTAESIAAARAGTPGWELTHIGGSSGRWVEDPREALRSADVVVTHAGQTALADVAAALRPAIVVPQRRPYGEQAASGRVLAAGPWPAIVVARMPVAGWGPLLAAAAALDGGGWRSWNDGGGA